MKSRTRTARKPDRTLDFECLEKRQLMAVANIFQNGDTLVIAADAAATSVEVRRVGIMFDISDVITKQSWQFGPWGIARLEFRGSNFGDTFFSYVSGIPVIAYGYGGNDTLVGYDSADRLYGSGGIDTLIGGGGNDVLDGGAGTQTDYLYGLEGHDVLRGGGGNDWLFGGDGNDSLYGGSGNDWLYGGNGGDQLYGGAGTDRLYGEQGNDGLFGGIGNSDYLNGGSNRDRFLYMGIEDTIADLQSFDARIRFSNQGPITVPLKGFGDVKFAAGSWTNWEIKSVDSAFANLHRIVSNTRLLKTAIGSELTFLRSGAQLNGQQWSTIGGWNSGTSITITNNGFADPNSGLASAAGVRDTVYHEIAHNWDDPDENWRAAGFQALSNWRIGPATGYSPSTALGDNWYYQNEAKFARDYGRHNPEEDYATTWEAYFDNKFHNRSMLNQLNYVDAKLANLDLFFASIRS